MNDVPQDGVVKDAVLQRRFHHLPFVLVAGAIGGALAYLGGITGVVLTAPLWNDNQFLHLLLHICFGALTAGVFVYLVANTDREDFIRMSFLAALVGVFWNPTLLAAKALLDARSAQKEQVAELKQAAMEIVQTTTAADAAVSKVNFSKFLDKYSNTLDNSYFPDYKIQLEKDSSVKALFEEASKQPWFGQEYKDFASQYPNIKFERLTKPQ
jgi:hypothetical protein